MENLKVVTAVIGPISVSIKVTKSFFLYRKEFF